MEQYLSIYYMKLTVFILSLFKYIFLNLLASTFLVVEF